MSTHFMTSHTPPLLTALLLTLLPLWITTAQMTGSGTPSTRSSHTLHALRIANGGVTVDGRLTEDAWHTAVPTDSFNQKEPVEGGTPLERSEVRLAYDDEAVYFGARLFVRHPDSIQAIVSRRDNVGNSERILFSIDTYNDSRTAYTFGVTATGVRIDYYHAEDKEFSRDYTFDPVWEATTSIDSTSWYAELRIPFSQLRFTSQEVQQWGLNMNRYIPSTNEDIYWVVIPKNATGWSSRFGSITGIAGVTAHRPIELVPYVAGEALQRSSGDDWSPFERNTRTARIGLDMKMGLSNALTLDATIHPDFGQVEADPAEVNLSAYETYFSERRPFFTEGSQLLSGIGPAYFYSRRIGAAPKGGVDADHVSMPTSTAILGAAKVSGRLASGLSLAALSAVTAREYAETYDGDSQRRGEWEVEPLTGFAVARIQQEFGPAASTAGAMMTLVRRDIPSTGLIGSQMVRDAFSGGADWDLRFNNGAYSLRGFAGMSHVAGNAAAILRIQRSPAHYFQRPDQSHVRVDSSRTSLTGYAAGLTFQKHSGEHWLFQTGASVESPEFEINDAGRVASVDNIDASYYITWRENVPSDWFHSISVSHGLWAGWNYGGITRYVTTGLELSITWKNFWGTYIYFDTDQRALSDNLTRGGPLMESPFQWRSGITANSNYANPTQMGLEGHVSHDELGGWSTSTEANLAMNPTGRLKITLSAEWGVSVSARQYVTRIASPLSPTFGNRYVFAGIDRSTVSMGLRANYAFSPDLTLEVYAEPFAASGRYFDFGELQAASSMNLRRYGTDGSIIEPLADGSQRVTDGTQTFILQNSDFHVLSFRSNVVLRWEWLRGSTLFVVWQQNRGSQEMTGERIRPGQILDSFAAPGDNLIAIKLSYWLPV